MGSNSWTPIDDDDDDDDRVTQKVKVGSILGEGFDTYYGVKQGDPLSTDLFGIMIEILDEYLKLHVQIWVLK